MKTQGDINEKIRNGTALVMTAAEFKQHIRDGDTMTPDEVDVVTTGTFGVMSGTYAVLSITPKEAPSVLHPPHRGSSYPHRGCAA